MYLFMVLSLWLIGILALLVWVNIALLLNKGDWKVPAKWLLIFSVPFGVGLLATGVLA